MLSVVAPVYNEEALIDEFYARVCTAMEGLEFELVLVDDGSTDGSPDIARSFVASHPFATMLSRPPRSPERDRLASAAELVAFQWALGQAGDPYDVVAKLDADLVLPPELFAEIERRLEAEPCLGLVGPYLSVLGPDGSPVREPCPPAHVRGPTKFYRRACYDQITPLRPALGWDTIDEVKARMSGWRTASFALAGGDPLHLRPTGAHDGRLRSWRRFGLVTYAYGAHPLHVLAVSIARVAKPPPVIGSVNFLAGWVGAWVRSVPRAEPDVRAFVHKEQLARLKRIAAARLCPRPRATI